MAAFLCPQTPPAFSNTVGGSAPATSAPLPSPTPMTTTLGPHDQNPYPHGYSTAEQPASCPQPDMNDFRQSEMETRSQGAFEWGTHDERGLHDMGMEVQSMQQQQEQQIWTGHEQQPEPHNTSTYAHFQRPSFFEQQQGQNQAWQPQQTHFPPQPHLQPAHLPPLSMYDHNQHAITHSAPNSIMDPYMQIPSHFPSHAYASTQAWSQSQPHAQFQYEAQAQTQAQAQAAQFCILASAARKAEVEVMVRDMGEVGLM